MLFRNLASLVLTILWFAICSATTVHAQTLNKPPITIDPNTFPDDYNYETGPLVRALKKNDALYHLFVNGCASACAYNETLCNVRSKNMGLFSYSSTENLPKSWSNLKCMLDVKDQANPAALMQVCSSVCTENFCYGNDTAIEFCRKFCCQTAVNLKEASNPGASNAKRDANTFIQNCHGMQGFGDNGICQNYPPTSGTRDRRSSRTPANVMTNRPDAHNIILNSPLSHPTKTLHLPMNNNAMHEKMDHLPHPPVNANQHNMNHHNRQIAPHMSVPPKATLNHHKRQITPHMSVPPKANMNHPQTHHK